MNSLSWLVYFIGVIGNAGAFFVIMWFILICIFLLGSVGFGLSLMESYDDECRIIKSNYKTFCKWTVPVFVILSVFSIFLPSRQTMLIIAASEIGERVVTNETVQKEIVDPSITLLKKWIEQENKKYEEKK